MKKPIKLSREIVSLLFPRLADEFDAFFFYRSASNWCKGEGFMKAAEFFAKESEIELEHAKKIEDYLVDWNVMFKLPSIEELETKFSSLLDIIEKAYEIEYALYEAYEQTSVDIFKTGDLCVFDFLQFFRQTQKDSVAEYSDMLNMLEGTKEGDKFEMLVLEKKLF